MSDHPMTPDQAREVLRLNGKKLHVGHRHALETIAHMDMEEENIMTYDMYGGLHHTVRLTRLVGEWGCDE